MENKNLENKINNTYYIILITLASSFLICLCFIIIFIFKSHFVINISGDDADKNITMDIITAIVGVVSAYLIYLGFRQQVVSNESTEERFKTEKLINKVEKDFDTYMKLIDDVEKFENRIQMIRTTVHHVTIKETKGNVSIDAYVSWLKQTDDIKQLNHFNKLDLERDLFVHLVNIKFILTHTMKLKKDFTTYYIILNTKLFIIIPHLPYQLKDLILYEKEITNSNRNQDGILLYKEIKAVKELIDSFPIKAETPKI